MSWRMRLMTKVSKFDDYISFGEFFFYEVFIFSFWFLEIEFLKI